MGGSSLGNGALQFLGGTLRQATSTTLQFVRTKTRAEVRICKRKVRTLIAIEAVGQNVISYLNPSVPKPETGESNLGSFKAYPEARTMNSFTTIGLRHFEPSPASQLKF